MKRLFNRRIRDVDRLFRAQYLDPRALYVILYNRIPVMAYVEEVDEMKGFEYVQRQLKTERLELYQHYYFDHEGMRNHSIETIYILKNRRMIVQSYQCFHLFHLPGDYDWAETHLKALAALRKKEERQAIGFSRPTNAQ